MRKILGKIHVPIGLMILALAIAANAAEPKLIIASTHSGTYKTKLLFAQPNASAPAVVSINEPGCLTGLSYVVPAHGALALNATQMVCGEYVLIDAPPTPYGASVITFDDGKTPNSFTIGPIGTITNGQQVGPLVSTADEGTWITLFPLKTEQLTVDLYDGSGIFLAREFATIAPPVTQYRIKARFEIGFARVFLGDIQFGVGPPAGKVWGFASSGTPLNGNFRAFPF